MQRLMLSLSILLPLALSGPEAAQGDKASPKKGPDKIMEGPVVKSDKKDNSIHILLHSGTYPIYADKDTRVTEGGKNALYSEIQKGDRVYVVYNKIAGGKRIAKTIEKRGIIKALAREKQPAPKAAAPAKKSAQAEKAPKAAAEKQPAPVKKAAPKAEEPKASESVPGKPAKPAAPAADKAKAAAEKQPAPEKKPAPAAGKTQDKAAEEMEKAKGEMEKAKAKAKAEKTKAESDSASDKRGKFLWEAAGDKKPAEEKSE